MSDNRFVWDGLAELRQALRDLPATLTGESSHIVLGAANGAAAQVKANYARVSGDLVDGVQVIEGNTQFSAAARVVSKSKHAWIYENGTQVRHYLGASRGAMPPAPPGKAFIPVMITKRRRMYEDLKGVLVRNGLSVTGDAR
jgi:hypothetical protein